MNKAIKKRRAEIYRAVKAWRPDLYESAVRIGNMAMPEFYKPGTDALTIAAEIESAAMLLAARAAGIVQ